MTTPRSATTTDNGNHSRRDFIRTVGGAVFALTLVDIADPKVAHASVACGSGTVDLLCSGILADGNCHISQIPSSSKDHDQHCVGLLNQDEDKSCGDCDDIHDKDQHCGKQLPSGATDPDGLCGHQHNVGLDEDDVCSATVSDVGCGTHETPYGGEDEDPDQHCNPQQQVPDMDCSGEAGGDAHCNIEANPSTTSPDERCSATDHDAACSHYDADESCGMIVNGNNTEDQSCGTYDNPNPLGDDYRDADNYCPVPIADNDDSDDPNTGPIAPYCPNANDADYWDPPE